MPNENTTPKRGTTRAPRRRPANPKPAAKKPDAGPPADPADDAPVPVIDARDEPAEKRPFLARIVAAMADAEQVTKSRTNTDQNYKFASAEDMLKAVRGPLLRHGIALFSHPQTDQTRETEIRSRNNAQGMRVVLVTDYEFVDGETSETYRIEGWEGEGQDYGDKAMAKARTNSVKTFIRAQWLLPVDDDTDPEASSPHERVAPPAAAPEFPVWAQPARDNTKPQTLRDAEALIGGDRERAKLVLKSIADEAGHMPRVVSWVLRRLVEASQQPPSPAPADPAQEASGEEPQAATAPDPTAPEQPPVDEQPPADGRTPEDGGPIPRADPEDAPDKPRLQQALTATRKLSASVVERMARIADAEGTDPYFRHAARIVWWERADANAATLAAADGQTTGDRFAANDPEFDGSAEDVPPETPVPGASPPATVELSNEDLMNPEVLVTAGCTCAAPLANPPELDSTCPIVGHGIAF